MPWTSAEVDRFKKGLTAKQKEKWVQIANNTLRACLKDGGEELDCEVKAVRVANGSFSERRDMSLANAPNPLRPTDHGARIELATAEAEAPDEEGFQLAFPIGLFRTSKYGELIITRTFAQRMLDHWQSGALGQRSVFLDTNHDFDEANGWAVAMKLREDGLAVKWDFNQLGKERIADKRYRYFSAAIGYATDLETGEELFPVLQAVSLTNTPVMYSMPEAHLSDNPGSSEPEADTETPPAHSDEGPHSTPKEGNTMISLVDVLGFCQGASAEEKALVLKELGAAEAHQRALALAADVKTLTGERDILAKANTDLAAKLTQLQGEQKAKAKAEAIQAALTEGRILPRDKTYWEGKFDENPGFTAEVLAKLPKAVDLGEHGHGGGGEEKPAPASEAVTAEERAALLKLGLSAEEIDSYAKAKQEGGR